MAFAGGCRRRRGAARLPAAMVLAVLCATAAGRVPAWADGADRADAATLVVAAGGDRTAPGTVAGLPGASFGFYPGTSGAPPATGATPVAVCTTTAPGGTCGVRVPARAAAGTGYWIVELSAPPGYRVAGPLDVGDAGTALYHRLFTGPVDGGSTHTFPRAGTVRGGLWADVRTGPAGPVSCGARLALLLDTSDAVGTGLSTVESAAESLVDALTGTSASVAVYRFADRGALVDNLTALPDAASAGPVKAAIDALKPGGATDWGAGLWQIAASPVHYDAVLMLTGGNPTGGTGETTRYRDLENAIFSANAVKAKGTSIRVVGVGRAPRTAPDKVTAIDGAPPDTSLNRDAPLGTVLRDFARDACRGTVTVVEKVVPAGGDGSDAVPGPGWTIDARTGNVTPGSASTGAASGAATFTAPRGTAATGQPVQLNEVAQPGYEPYPVDGHRADCRRGDGTPVPATDVGGTGFRTTLIPDDLVTCTVYHRLTGRAKPAQVRVDQDWTIDGRHYADGAAPPEFQAELSIVGQDQPVFGQSYGGYTDEDFVKIGETVAGNRLPAGCTYRTTGDAGEHDLSAGLNVFTLTTAVTCTGREL